MGKVKSIRLDEKRLKMLKKISEATRVPESELIKQGLDRVMETYGIYLNDEKFKEELNFVMDDSEKYLKKLADED